MRFLSDSDSGNACRDTVAHCSQCHLCGRPHQQRRHVAIVAFGINSGAYVAEIIRAGIMAVDRGQMEAGRSLGLSNGMTMQKIILPQAVKNILPAMGNEFITLIKETAVVGYVAVEDLTKMAELHPEPNSISPLCRCFYRRSSIWRW